MGDLFYDFMCSEMFLCIVFIAEFVFSRISLESLIHIWNSSSRQQLDGSSLTGQRYTVILILLLF